MHRFDITLAGEFNLDLLLYGLPEELPVERELLASQAAMALGGSPAITAHNLAALGSRVGFVTKAAGDAFAHICQREMEMAGVDLACVAAAESIGTGVTVLLQHEGVRRTVTYPGTTTQLSFEDIDLHYLASARHFHLSSYFLQTALQPDIPRLLSFLKEAGLTISLDTNDDPSGCWDHAITEVLRYVDILLPNEGEACQLAHTSTLSEAVTWLQQFVPLVVVKRGAAGADAYTREKKYKAAGIKTQAIDAVGAGDSFNAGFLHGFLKDWPIDRCLEFGNLAGAWSVTAMGGVAAFKNRTLTQRFFSQSALQVK